MMRACRWRFGVFEPCGAKYYLIITCYWQLPEQKGLL